MTTPSPAPTTVLDLVNRWAEAAAANSAELLDGLLTDDFHGVGPVGFVLGRDMWLGRFDHGLVNHAFAVEDPQIREHGDSAVVIGVQAQKTTAKNTDSSGRFRVSLVAVRQGDGWKLANVHIGQLQVRS